MGAMDWLNGIMGPTAQFGGQPSAPQGPPLGGAGMGMGGMPGMGAPGMRGMPGMGGAVGALGGALLGGVGALTGQGMGQGMQGAQGMQGPTPGQGLQSMPQGMALGLDALPPPGTGYTSPYASGAPGGEMGGYAGAAAPGVYAPGPPGGPPPGAQHGAAADARVLALQRDVDSLALFARTLLTVMVERQVLTMEQFQEAKRRLDMMDGKLDDR